MKHDFGDIRLFNEAIAENRTVPPIEAYLQSTGLSDSEVAEVQALFEIFCAAIENAPSVGLPDLANGTAADSSLGTTLVN